ncbi:MAG: right-handed parallel beta-helix repeat-containing protein [Thermoplasmatota archaeon]
MKKNIFVLFIIPLLIGSQSYALYTIDIHTIHQTGIIYVDGNNTLGPWYGTLEHPYQYISDAISSATPGDRISVANGIYTENLIINKSLTITGQDTYATIIDGSYNPTIIDITADAVTIQHFTLQNSGGDLYDAGIYITSSQNSIQSCFFYRTKIGIHLDTTTNNTITNCTFTGNGKGIVGRYCLENIIHDCRFSHNSIGIVLEHSHFFYVKSCIAHTNSIGIFLHNSSSLFIEDNALYDNNDNQGGIFVSECAFLSIKNCNIVHNGFGIKLDGCHNVSIVNSNFYTNTHYAIYMNQHCSDVKIISCSFIDNLRYSLLVDYSQLEVTQSNFINSLVGLEAKHSTVKARRNYWGFAFGPGLFDWSRGDRIFSLFGFVQIFPWYLRMVDDAGADWEIDYSKFIGAIDTTRYSQIEIPGLDSDNDGCPDWWEIKWGYDPYTWDDHANLDQDGDGLNNIEECYMDAYGANPFRKDIFVEIDWMSPLDADVSNTPSDEDIQRLIDAFDAYDISFHVDVGNLGGGQEIAVVNNYSFSDLTDLYWMYFLDGDLNNPRKGIFHYCLVSDYGPGRGYSFMGWDHLDSFQLSVKQLHNTFPQYTRSHVLSSGLLHELGHTLGLFVDDHGGNDNMVAAKLFTAQWWKYRNYRSTMNYFYTYKILDYSDGSHGPGDFNDWGSLDLSFFKNTSFAQVDL